LKYLAIFAIISIRLETLYSIVTEIATGNIDSVEVEWESTQWMNIFVYNVVTSGLQRWFLTGIGKEESVPDVAREGQ
jgi:hypothetical protein